MFAFRPVERIDFAMICGFPQSEEELFFVYSKGRYPLSVDQLEDARKGRHCPTVLSDEGKVVAYANLYGLVPSEECWLGNVIVAPEYRGTGAATELIRVMKSRAREELEVRRLCLVCHSSNPRALVFYAKCGFKPFEVASGEDYCGRRIAKIHMAAEL